MFCLLFVTIFGMALGQGGQLETVTDLTRSDIQEMAKFAVQEYNNNNHMITGVHETLDSVVSAKTQVVSGTNYYLTVDMAVSGVINMRCDFTVWYQSWTKVKSVTKEHCYKHTKRAVGQIVGFMAAAEFATNEMNAKSNSLFRDALVTVNHVSEQAVSGVLYRMVITIGQTSCRNNGMALGGCVVASHAMTKICKVNVLEQAWMNPSLKLTESTCM